ncbi:protein inturned isoform X1 [Dendroctonus ponderosae]|uniref:Protein inturned n=1 Tax=Dendroctonus ponderosae TaxID=77166 RepID=A0AAR5P0P1_DENPD|nr:protein inturned isoform X1 [Dendroctonus ponderosae]XP_019754087.1 protein inturned isoform X1 [Dendroctonus ponderosae]
MESQRLLPLKDVKTEDPFPEDWSDSDSSYSDSESDSSVIPDWEPFVDDFSGELLYIDCHPFVTNNRFKSKVEEEPDPFAKSQLRRSTRGKFLRLLRRRESKRVKKSQKPLEDGLEINTQKVKFQDFQEGEEKEVTLEIDRANRYNLSSYTSLAESLLGLIISTLSDGNRVMIAGFSYDSKAKNERNIKIGDWLKSINSIEVNVHNLDDSLQKFINHDEVVLTLQRVAATEVTKDPPINTLNMESAFVRDLLNAKLEDNQALLPKMCRFPVGLVYINIDKLDESNKANEDIIYCFPKPAQKNLLSCARGMFITLSHLVEDITSTPSRLSCIMHKDKLLHVVYTRRSSRLLLFMLPDERASSKEVVLMNAELLSFLEFTFGDVDRGLSEQQDQVDLVLFRYFAKLICNDDWTTIEQFLEYQPNLSPNPNSCSFEGIMPVVPTLKLHDEAITQLDEALTELEASDYREWNEDPLDCQRLFTILGSALFHSGYLLHSHLMQDDLVDVFTFCKLQGLVHLAKTEPVKSLVLWKEVYPKSCKVQGLDDVHIPEGRRYLLVVGAGKDVLTVIMEAGGATEPSEENMGPDAFYVEEAQATLAHVQALGLGVVAERFLAANGGFQLAAPLPPVNKKKSDFIGSLGFSKSSPTQSQLKDPSVPAAKKSEVISILKRRSSDQNVLAAPHEDAFDAYSEASSQSFSDESLSRNRNLKYDSEEDSDFDDYGDGSQISSSSCDLSEIRQSLLSDQGGFLPVQLTCGRHNVLFHFVQLDSTEGMLVTPLECNLQYEMYPLIMNNFRRCCQNIHDLFQSTLRFKSLPAQDIAKSLMNKSLIAIKEYGMLFECPTSAEPKRSKIAYWVIGRLFYTPHPQELYVCYQDSVPQNLVDFAFKISLNSVV